jgi:hypothetical protein
MDDHHGMLTLYNYFLSYLLSIYYVTGTFLADGDTLAKQKYLSLKSLHLRRGMHKGLNIITKLHSVYDQGKVWQALEQSGQDLASVLKGHLLLLYWK